MMQLGFQIFSQNYLLSMHRDTKYFKDLLGLYHDVNWCDCANRRLIKEVYSLITVRPRINNFLYFFF